MENLILLENKWSATSETKGACVCVCVRCKHLLHANTKRDHAVVVSQFDWWRFHIRPEHLQVRGSSTWQQHCRIHQNSNNTGTSHLFHWTRGRTPSPFGVQRIHIYSQVCQCGVYWAQNETSKIHWHSKKVYFQKKKGKCAFAFWDETVEAAGRTPASSNRIAE